MIPHSTLLISPVTDIEWSHSRCPYPFLVLFRFFSSAEFAVHVHVSGAQKMV